jgi:hypothetical protein
MKKPIKILDHIEFIKLYLSQSGNRPKCHFCKYYAMNYVTLDAEVKEYFFSRCSDCQYLKTKNPKKYYSNNFKTLYDWEEGE